MVEVIAELGAFLFFAFYHAGNQMRVLPQVVAHFRQQSGVFSKTLHQDVARAVQRRFDVSHAFLCVDKAGGQLLRLLGRILPQRIGQRLQTRLDGDLTARAALRLIGQVEIFEFGFTQSAINCGGEFITEFALVGNGFQNRLATILQLAQITETGFQLSQLGIIKPAGYFLTITCDKRHGIPFIQQADRGVNLFSARLKFTRNNAAQRIIHHRFNYLASTV